MPDPTVTRPDNLRCTNCGWITRQPREYHPYVACIIFKATRRDPLPYLRQVAADMATVNEHGQFLLPGEEVEAAS